MYRVLGTKKLMSQVFSDKGEVVPVTVIDLDGLVVAGQTADKTLIGIGKKKNFSKAEEGKYKELGFVPVRVMELDKESLKDKKIGDEVSAEIFENISKVDVSGIAKGKGFASVIRRWNFKGGPKTHGQSDRHRSPGSIGAGTTPGRVLKGKKMGGRYGGKKITVKNLDVIKVDKTNNLILVKGGVPGSNNSIVVINIYE